jgi:hypothetical protein
MRRRAVARFGFGGKLAVAKPPIGRDSVRAVSVRTLTLEPELKAHSEAFEEAISGDLRSYCQQKAHVEADPEREYWSFIEARFRLCRVPFTLLDSSSFLMKNQASVAHIA